MRRFARSAVSAECDGSSRRAACPIARRRASPLRVTRATDAGRGVALRADIPFCPAPCQRT
jgi:hypothetical protein